MTDTKTPELAPCPFPHKKQDMWVASGYAAFYMYCNICEAMGPERETEAEAIAAWNDRHIPMKVNCIDCAHILNPDPKVSREPHCSKFNRHWETARALECDNGRGGKPLPPPPGGE